MSISVRPWRFALACALASLSISWVAGTGAAACATGAVFLMAAGIWWWTIVRTPDSTLGQAVAAGVVTGFLAPALALGVMFAWSELHGAASWKEALEGEQIYVTLALLLMFGAFGAVVGACIAAAEFAWTRT